METIKLDVKCSDEPLQKTKQNIEIQTFSY